MTDFKTLPSFPLKNGIQYIAKFPNNYGASIYPYISCGRETGLWEVEVIKYKPGETNLQNFDITWDTPITEYAICYSTEAEVNELVSQIEALPQAEEDEITCPDESE